MNNKNTDRIEEENGPGTIAKRSEFEQVMMKRSEFEQATHAEYSALMKSGTWIIVDGLNNLKAANIWKTEALKLMTQMGFERSNTDSYVFFQKNTNGLEIIAQYMDDLIIAAQTMSRVQAINKELEVAFNTKIWTSRIIEHGHDGHDGHGEASEWKSTGMIAVGLVSDISR
jgi:hypothetical protein